MFYIDFTERHTAAQVTETLVMKINKLNFHEFVPERRWGSADSLIGQILDRSGLASSKTASRQNIEAASYCAERRL